MFFCYGGKSVWFFLQPRSNKQCFLNGVFQSGVFQGLARICAGRRHQNAGKKKKLFSGILCPPEKGLPLSLADVRNLKNTIWKTPFGTLRYSFSPP